MSRVFLTPSDCEYMGAGWGCKRFLMQQLTYNCFSARFAPLLQKQATADDPSRVIVTASVAGLGVGMLGQNATFGYSASKGFSPSSARFPDSHSLSSNNYIPKKLTFFPSSPRQAAVIHLTRNLAVELGPRHILCNSIAPGFFPSKMASGLLEMTGGVEEMGKSNPNGRLGRPEDIAGTVVYLASRAASHVSGTCIVLDGGGLWAKGRL